MSEEKKPYTYADLENDLKELTPEEKKREVIMWREDDAFKTAGLSNDRQPYYSNEETPEDGIISQEDYNSLDEETKSEYKIVYPNGVTVLWEDF